MTDEQETPPDEPTPRPGQDPVGSVAEEAAKLFAAFADVARDRGAGFGDAAAAAASGLSGALNDVSEHVARGEDCRYCPVCQVIRLVRDTDPEVKNHLATAASSLVQAAAGLLATHVPQQQDPRASGVEKIDLEADDEGWDG